MYVSRPCLLYLYETPFERDRRKEASEFYGYMHNESLHERIDVGIREIMECSGSM